MFKKILLLVALVLLSVVRVQAQCTTTPNIPLQKVNPGATSGWDTCINNNFTILDTLLGGVGSLSLNSTTPTVLNQTTWKASNSSTTAITNFTNGFQGQRVTIVCNDSNTSFTSGATMDVNSNFNCTGALSGSISFVLSGSVWTEISRSTNAQQNRVCDIAVGDTSGSAVTDAQLGPQTRICFIPATATIIEMDVDADAGTPNVIVGRNHAGSITNIVSSALATAGSGGIACSNTGGTTGLNGVTTCSSTLQNTSLVAGDYLELVSGTAGGTAKLMTIHIIYTVNN